MNSRNLLHGATDEPVVADLGVRGLGWRPVRRVGGRGLLRRRFGRGLRLRRRLRLRLGLRRVRGLEPSQTPWIFSRFRTCSVGWAPSASQYSARSASISMNDGSSIGWYFPMCLDEPSVARAAGVGHDDPVEGALRGPQTHQPDLDHSVLLLRRGRTRASLRGRCASSVRARSASLAGRFPASACPWALAPRCRPARRTRPSPIIDFIIFLRLRELLQQRVDLLCGGARSAGDPEAPAAVDDSGVARAPPASSTR